MKFSKVTLGLLVLFMSCVENEHPQPSYTKISHIPALTKYLNEFGYEVGTTTSLNLVVNNVSKVGTRAKLINSITQFYQKLGYNITFTKNDKSEKNGRLYTWECYSGPLYCSGNDAWCSNYVCFDGDRMDFSTSCFEVSYCIWDIPINW